MSQVNQVSQASEVNQAFEKFLQGEDRLACLLCELPAYAPSAEAEFAAVFARAARAAQAQGHASQPETAAGPAAASGNATPDDGTRLDAIPSAFQAPASLEASFLKMAASIESAQAPRREAILSGIARGDSPQAMLGATIAPSSEEWLRAQAPAAGQTEPGAPSPAVQKRSFLGLRWFDLRLAALACVLAVIGTRLALMHDPEPAQVAGQVPFQTAMLSKEASQEAKLAAPEQEAPPTPRKKSAASAAAPQARLADAADGPKPASPSLPPPAAPAGKLSLAEVIEAPAQQLASEPPRSSPFASGMADEARADARSAKEAKRLANEAPAERPTTTAPGRPNPAAPAAAPSVAASPAPTSHQQATDGGISATLADDPARIASQLPARAAGAVWTVYSSQPHQPELARWLDILHQHMPESSRPARFELIKDDANPGGPGDLRIVPPALSQREAKGQF